MAVAEIHYENGRDKMPGEIQQQGEDNPAAKAIGFWRDLGLVWKGIGGALALGLLAWNLGAFAVPFRISALEKADSGVQVDLKQLKADVSVLTIDMARVSADMSAVKEGLKGFRGEVLAEVRAGLAEMKAATAGSAVHVASSPAPAAARRPPAVARKQAAVKPAHQPAKWLPF